MKRPKKIGSTLPKRETNMIFNRRAALMSFAGAGVLGAILFRMGQLQATNLISREYTDAADDNRFDTRIIAPPRGILYDRFGTVLAQTSKDYQVGILQSEVQDLEEVIGRVAAILGYNGEWARRAAIRVRGGSRYEAQPISEGLTWDQFNAINVRLPELPGVVANSADVRAYPYDVVYAHPIGYVQKPTQRDVDRAIENPEQGETRAMYLRNPHVRVGKAGLEASLEDMLHGQPGYRKVIVNARGVEMGEDEGERREPERGSGVVLTLDHELQRVAMESFGQDQSGAAVVMDILTGDLLVMASAPGFDPNLFVNGIAQEPFRVLNEDEKKPLFHKCVTGVYAPGSTFKMMVGIAAKQAGVEDDWSVSCPGYFPYGGRNFHCWERRGHGRVNLHNAIKHSCDVYFYQAALRAGPDRIAQVARQFGLGQHFDVSVPNINDGLIPDPAWWREHRHENWTGGLTLNYGIGQGAMGVTPLQLAVMAARLGNNGRAVTPRLVREAPGVGDPSQPAHMSGIESEYLARVRDGMYGVCNEPGGTAVRAGNMELVRHPETGAAVPLTQDNRGWDLIQVAGKTGTAQVRVISAAERASGVRSNASLDWRLRDNALFCCFGPWHEPRYACAVVVEHGGGGSAVAGPIARRIMRETLLRDPARRPAARLATLEIEPGAGMTMTAAAAPRTIFDRVAKLNWGIITILMALAFVGVLMHFSVSSGAWTEMPLTHGLRFAVMLAVVLIASMFLKVQKFWFELAYPLYALTLLLLVAVEIAGETRMGATRWLSIGPLTLQPSELMKISIVLALARYYDQLDPRKSGTLLWIVPPFLMIVAPVALIMHQPDLGTAMLILLAGIVMMFLGGLLWRIIAAGAIVAIGGAIYAYSSVLHGYQRARVNVFLGITDDPLGAGYHVLQSKIAIGSAGLFGRGYLQGTQSQLDFLPEKHTDFIFTMIVEEFGLFGGTVVLGLYAALMALTMRVAMNARSMFGKLAAAGVAATLACYVFINTAMVIGLVPVVGIPLPIISFGGTAMMTLLAGYAIVLSIDLHKERF